MEKETTKLEYKAGLFVGLGVILVLAAILALGGGRVAFRSFVHVDAYFDEVQGLFPGSVVALSGLPVGNVKTIEFSPGQNKLRVAMDVDRRFAAKLVEGTTADIRTQGALGDKYIYLVPGPLGAKQLNSGDVIPVNDSGDILKMLTSKDDGIGQALGLVKELRVLVAGLNANGRTTGALDNMNGAVVELKSTLGQIDKLVKDLRGELPDDKKFKQTIISLASVLEKIDQGKGTLGLLVNDPSVHQRLKAMLGGSQRNEYLKDVIRGTIQQSEAAKK